MSSATLQFNFAYFKERCLSFLRSYRPPGVSVLARSQFRRIVPIEIDVNQIDFLFICGLHRSGTSLVYRVLGQHDDFDRFHRTTAPEDEGQHLQTVMRRAKDCGGPGRFAFHPECRMTENMASKEIAHKLLVEWGRYAKFDKDYFVEKSPPNIIRSRFLQALFPNSAFLFIVRHPIVTSYATQKWARLPLDELVRHWIHAHNIMMSDRSHLRRQAIVRYEDFIRYPARELHRISESLDIPTAPANAKFEDLNMNYWLRWEDECDQQRRSAIKTLLENENILSQLGYSMHKSFIHDSWALKDE